MKKQPKKQPSNDENFDSGNSPKQVIDSEFEKILVEYVKIVRQLKLKAMEKYGPAARNWFGL